MLNHLDTLTAAQGDEARAFYQRHPEHIAVDIRHVLRIMRQSTHARTREKGT